MKLLHKTYMLIPVLALCMAFGPLVAGGFDTDVSDWSQGERGLCTKGERDNLNYVVEKYRRKLGVKRPVEIVEGKENAFFNYVERNGTCSRPHVITLDVPTQTLLNASFFSRAYRSSRRYAAIGSLCHELGHARQVEDPKHVACFFAAHDALVGYCQQSFWKWLTSSLSYSQLLSQLNRVKYEAELSADAAVPHEKKILEAYRDRFREHHVFCSGYSEELKPIASIDFTKPMHEEHAQAWDKWHQDHDDYHPSSYRRAHLFNARLEEFKVKERELCKKIAKHVQCLTTSDLM